MGQFLPHIRNIFKMIEENKKRMKTKMEREYTIVYLGSEEEKFREALRSQNVTSSTSRKKQGEIHNG